MNARRREREDAEGIQDPPRKRLCRSTSVSQESIVPEGSNLPFHATVSQEEQHAVPEKTGGRQISVKKEDLEETRSSVFSIVIWNYVSIAIFGRWMEQVRTCLVSIVRSWPSPPCMQDKSISLAMIQKLGEQMRLTWEAGKNLCSLSSSSIAKYNSLVSEGITQLVNHLEHLTSAQNDPLTLCRHYLRVMEEHGFMEDIDGDELGACLGGLKYAVYPRGYAYSERVSNSLSTAGYNTSSTSPTCDDTQENSMGPSDPTGRVNTKGRTYQVFENDVVKNNASPSPPSAVFPFSSPVSTSLSRVGYAVSVDQSPHLSSFITTTIQLIEPRKRRPPLDEYRIFSHPKKAMTHGVEDALVDEELRYRNLVILLHHFDTYGSFLGLSPFSRFCLYTSLGSADSKFFSLYEQPASTQAIYQELQLLRNQLETKKHIEQRTRCSLRETAQRVGWYAVSAQWRDQVLAALQNAEEADWYGLSDTVRGGFLSARFPNYACSITVKRLMVLVLEKIQSMKFEEQTGELGSPTASSVLVVDTVKSLFLPLLEGNVPLWSFDRWKRAMPPMGAEGTAIADEERVIPDPLTTNKIFSFVRRHGSEANSRNETSPLNLDSCHPDGDVTPQLPIIANDAWWPKVSMNLRRAFGKWVEHPPFGSRTASFGSLPTAVVAGMHTDRNETRGSDAFVLPSYRCPFYMKEEESEAVATILIPSMIFPLQCVAELLEVCSAALYSTHGIEVFSEDFLAAAPFESEEKIVEFLLEYEPTNVALTTLVAILKIFKDLMCSLPVLFSDMVSLAITIEAKHIFSEMGSLLLPSPFSARNYAYWKLLSGALEKEDSGEDLLFLFVRKKPSFEFTPSGAPSETSSIRCYSEGILERVTKVWPQEIAEVVREEEEWKKNHAF